MGLFSKKAKLLNPRKALDLIETAAKSLPQGAELPDVIHLKKLEPAIRANLLRKLYLDVEGELRRYPNSPWRDMQVLRDEMAEKFKLEKYLPDGFTVVFLKRGGQIFWLYRTLFETIWSKAEWPPERIQQVLTTAMEGTPLEDVHVVSDAGWGVGYRAFKKIAPGKQEDVLLATFQRLQERVYSELIKELGESRARIVLEKSAREMNTEFRSVDAMPDVMQALPRGILEEERISYASREELQDTVMRQMKELQGKNMALLAEAKQLHETIQSLEHAKDRSEAMTKAQQDFIQVVMHQFRTPLAALRWQAEALAEFSSDHEEFADLASMSDVLRQRSSFLAGQLENIFDLLALQSGDYRVQPEPLDLEKMLASVCGESRKDADRRAISLICESEGAPMVLADSDALRRVLRILMTNALGYTDENGSVLVTYETVKRKEGGEEARVHIKDTGIGIRPDDRPKLFKKFFRAKNAITRVPDGAGIALFIAKRIVELHNGRMWADSPGDGEGATFSFVLPLMKEDAVTIEPKVVEVTQIVKKGEDRKGKISLKHIDTAIIVPASAKVVSSMRSALAPPSTAHMEASPAPVPVPSAPGVSVDDARKIVEVLERAHKETQEQIAKVPTPKPQPKAAPASEVESAPKPPPPVPQKAMQPPLPTKSLEERLAELGGVEEEPEEPKKEDVVKEPQGPDTLLGS